MEACAVAPVTGARYAPRAMLTTGETIPDATVWVGPRDPVSLSTLAAERPLLLVFYLFDWSST
jgi:hypothetical protein